MMTAANVDHDHEPTAKEAAAALRADIKAAFKAGTLPAGVKLSVRSQGTYMGSVNVEIVEVPFVVCNPEFAQFIAERPGMIWHDAPPPRYTPEANELLKRLERMLDAYRVDRSDLQSDYHNCNFFGHVQYSCQAER